VAALQLLPPRQRAVLILRDVLGWSAAETAAALDGSVASVNSALQRARSTLERAAVSAAPRHEASVADRELLRRFMRAWEAVDIEGLVALLAEDALMTMPPVPMAVRGADEIGRFFASVPAEGRLDEIRLVPVAANRQPALAAYVLDKGTGEYNGYGVMVFALGGGRIRGIVGFADPSLFARFGWPRRSRQRRSARQEAEPGDGQTLGRVGVGEQPRHREHDRMPLFACERHRER
jgi:RNA polymerase sigma-70 factor (ECF subfamily)